MANMTGKADLFREDEDGLHTNNDQSHDLQEAECDKKIQNHVTGFPASDRYPAIPEGFRIMENQVAGHRPEKGKDDLAFLQCDDGTIFKPLHKPERGMREVNFYRFVFDPECKEDDVVMLRQFVPQYVGVHTGKKATYLRLGNVLTGFRKPCVADIKIGRKTYDHEATPRKIAKEVAKNPHLKTLGFQFAGMQVYNEENKKYDKYDKFDGQLIGEKNMFSEGLGRFFHSKQGLRKDVVRAVLKKLKSLEAWFVSQRTFLFYSTSILIAYDAIDNNSITTINGGPCESDDEQCNTKVRLCDFKCLPNGIGNGPATFHCADCDCDLTEVRMIDFTHTFHRSSTVIDENYLFGLRSLITYLDTLLDMHLDYLSESSH